MRVIPGWFFLEEPGMQAAYLQLHPELGADYFEDNWAKYSDFCTLCVNKLLRGCFLIDTRTSSWAVLHSCYRSN
jgi:hypothetical protein